LRLARQRLLGTSSPRTLRSAAQQQGLIQIVRDYCDHANAVCDQCGFPELVQQWTR
jgi:nucleoid-associated protein YejK